MFLLWIPLHGWGRIQGNGNRGAWRGAHVLPLLCQELSGWPVWLASLELSTSFEAKVNRAAFWGRGKSRCWNCLSDWVICSILEYSQTLRWITYMLCVYSIILVVYSMKLQITLLDSRNLQKLNFYQKMCMSPNIGVFFWNMHHRHCRWQLSRCRQRWRPGSALKSHRGGKYSNTLTDHEIKRNSYATCMHVRVRGGSLKTG